MVRKRRDPRGGQERRGSSRPEAPRPGDWQRHSTGATSGARGQEEGPGSPGERTWGVEQSAAERRAEQGRRQGEFGPRARRRSDESLAQEIREILNQDSELDADIEVEVEGGAVTLSGLVDGSDARLLAEELVETLPGVREVHNRLKVDGGEG